MKILFINSLFYSPSKLEGVSRSDEGVCVPDVETFPKRLRTVVRLKKEINKK